MRSRKAIMEQWLIMAILGVVTLAGVTYFVVAKFKGAGLLPGW